MRFAFDLWSHEDVARHAEAIIERLQAGTMPCDGAAAVPRPSRSLTPSSGGSTPGGVHRCPS
jgi:hypothetical protein